mmetsp:Transcript_11070/g.18092  ORF Transcript_11070/g.18092 Transcript_11070/m.18092 type:complete len:218 (-) Transcript_11070:844-1497(-)|eukprot:CAMPEP_0174970400 /NCGR_PEP_ID=MMETSP0004_2-20121128/9356_1 /TAXON_ID=420556 /ORGANISM="Ochromonas sp., Strain CCMP1393" /LENGTH=217 /DNA_ID=CAMNT_0016220115 /DNA_START=47 /DNA_END=700 /DNA_ORIENTATION=-
MGNKQSFKTDKVGFQITSIQPLSPGFDCGLQLKDDFILKMNGKLLVDMEPDQIMHTVKNSENRPVMLSVYSTRTKSHRELVMTPSSNWPGEGLIGIKIKLNTYEDPNKLDEDDLALFRNTELEIENLYANRDSSITSGEGGSGFMGSPMKAMNFSNYVSADSFSNLEGLGEPSPKGGASSGSGSNATTPKNSTKAETTSKESGSGIRGMLKKTFSFK